MKCQIEIVHKFMRTIAVVRMVFFPCRCRLNRLVIAAETERHTVNLFIVRKFSYIIL